MLANPHIVDMKLFEESLHFSSDVALAGKIFRPLMTNTRRIPGVLICHGIPGGISIPGDTGYPDFAREVAGHGFAAMVFNFRGCGESGGDLDLAGWRRDWSAAFEQLYRFSYVDQERLYIIGFSAGAAVSVVQAADDLRVQGLAACACPASFEFMDTPGAGEYLLADFRRRGLIKSPDFPPDYAAWRQGFIELNPERKIAGLAGRQVLILHGDRDETIPVEHAARLLAAAKEPKKLVVIPGAPHRLRQFPACPPILFKWLKEL